MSIARALHFARIDCLDQGVTDVFERNAFVFKVLYFKRKDNIKLIHPGLQPFVAALA